MSIPPSVARRRTRSSQRRAGDFLYVRRFVSTGRRADEFVPVTIRLSGNGAAVPFSLTDVETFMGRDHAGRLDQCGTKAARNKS